MTGSLRRWHGPSHGRGLTGTLRVGYVGAAGQLVMTAATRFRRSQPACAVEAREVQVGGKTLWIIPEGRTSRDRTPTGRVGG